MLSIHPMVRSSRRRRLSALGGVVALAFLAAGVTAALPAQTSREQRTKTDRKDVSSCESITRDSLNPSGALSDELQGQVPGLEVHGIDARSGAGTFLRLRGNSSIGSNTPLIYVDDVRIPPVQVGTVTRHTLTVQSFLNGLDFVNPEEVARIEILRGPAATTQYGMDAANGVIRIYTKRGPKGGTKGRDKVGCP